MPEMPAPTISTSKWRCVSSLAESVNVQPSGVYVVAGGDDSTRPSSTGAASGAGASAETASVSGSADATGASAHVNTQVKRTAKVWYWSENY